MIEHKSEDRIQTGEFSLAFQQMCNFIAVAQFGKPAETVKGLIQLCFVLLDERYESHLHLAKTIEILFGVRIPYLQMENAVNQLLSAGVLKSPAGTNLTLNPEAKSVLKERIEARRGVEQNTKSKWLQQIEVQFPKLDPSHAWEALQEYLRGAFRRHGIQTVAFFDPDVETPPDAEQSLSTLLRLAIKRHFDKADRDDAERCFPDSLRKLELI